MAGQIVALVRPAGNAVFSVAEAGAVIDVGGSVGVPGQRDIAADVERVALVVVERAESGEERDIGQSAGDGAAAFGDLIGIGEVKLRRDGRMRGERSVSSQPRITAC